MTSSLETLRVAFTGKQAVELQPFELPAPAAGQVLVQTECSLMSTGTENIVFNRLFDEGTHWDRWVKYPFYPGYSAAGTVLATGRDVKSLATGDRVVFRAGHQSHAVVDEGKCISVPDELPLEQAVWFALAIIAFHGARAAEYGLGDTALIIGAGPIGQMSVRWASAAGTAAVLAADLVPGRLAIARDGGATGTILTPIAEAREALLAACGGKLPRVVVDSTGNAAVFSAALGLVERFGTLVLLGDTGHPARQTLTSDVIIRGLRIIGAHAVHDTPAWHLETITRLFFTLAISGRFRLENLTSHRFLPRECAEAYDVANRDRAQTMGILFAWNQ